MFCHLDIEKLCINRYDSVVNLPRFYADVAELVDALVSGTSELNTRGGSSPLVRTRICTRYERFHDLFSWNLCCIFTAVFIGSNPLMH